VRFAEVWERHNDIVHRRCVKLMGGCRDEADEAYSRTAVQALQKWRDDFGDLEHAKAWLLTVARNVCMDIYRERRSRREISLDSDTTEGRPEGAAFVLPILQHPEDQYVEREQGRLMRTYIDELPPLLRCTATLYFVREMSYGDVARHLGITEVNVRKRIQQARERLRSAIRASSARSSHRLSAASAPPPQQEAAVLYAVTVTTVDSVQRDVLLELPLPRRNDPRRLERLQTNLRLHPRSRSKRLELARVLASRGQLAEAVPHYQFMLSKQCFRLHPWLELGAILEAFGQVSEAVELYKRGAAEAGRPGDRMHLGALELFTRDALEDAHAAIRDGIARDPGCARHPRLLGRIALARGDGAEAVASLERGLALDRRDPLAPLLLHAALTAGGRRAEARERLVRSLDGGEENPGILERLIAELCGGSAADRTQAAALLPSLLRLAPDSGGTRICESLVLFASGSAAEAEQVLAAYVGRHLRHAVAWRWLARIRRERGRPALGAALMARDLDPADREAWLEVCRVLTATPNSAAARHVVEAIAIRFPHDGELLAAAAVLESKI
jgi:RNA polymerase sigma factor (sigma-70 family)